MVGSWIAVDGLKPENWENTTDLGQWFNEVGSCGRGSRKEEVRTIAMLIVWELWKERNNRVFDRRSRSAPQLFDAIRDEAKTWVRASNKGLEMVLPALETAATGGQDGGDVG